MRILSGLEPSLQQALKHLAEKCLSNKTDSATYIPQWLSALELDRETVASWIDHSIAVNRWLSLPLLVSPECEVSVFFLTKTCVIPLHDHPHMKVWMKVISGNISVASFDWITGSNARHTQSVVLGPGLDIHTLEETARNVHTVSALTPSAFIDVMIPPYSVDEDRICSYYQVQSVAKQQAIALGASVVLSPCEQDEAWSPPKQS